MKNLSFILFAMFLLASCADPKANQDAAGDTQAVEGQEAAAETFGETITADGAISLAELPAKLAEADSVEVKLIGKVSSVCQVKGCWMEMESHDDSEAESIFVRFKDYGFFMPLDLGGSEVVIRGKAFRSVTTVDELKHYAEDEGLPQEEIDAITEPKEELKFEADGVIVTERS